MAQYADDLTMFLSDAESAQSLFQLLDQFNACSGLKVHYTITEAMWIGSCRESNACPLGNKMMQMGESAWHLFHLCF